MEENVIINILNEKSLTLKQLLKSLKLSKEKSDELKIFLEEMEKKGLIHEDEEFYYHINPSNYYVTELNMNSKKNAYVIIDGVYCEIDLESLGSALQFDTVLVEKLPKGKARVVKVVEKRKNKIVCEVVMQSIDGKSKKTFIQYLNGNEIPLDIDKKGLKKLAVGERILVDRSTGEILEILGHKDDPNIDLKCIALNNGIELEIPQDVIKESETIIDNFDINNYSHYTDLRDKLSITIDPATCKDMDDSVSVEMLSNGNYLLQVHIVNIGAFVSSDSKIFRNICERCFSSYILDSVIPMFDHMLSNGLFSLNENEDRLAVTTSIEIDKDGNVVNYDIDRTIIRSKKKFSYDEVNKCIEEGVVPTNLKEFETLLLDYIPKLNEIMSNKRDEKESFTFDSSEQVFDINGDDVEIKVKNSRVAEKFIENAMILANVYFIKDFMENGLPTIYRNNPFPNIFRLEMMHKDNIFNIKYDDYTDPSFIYKLLKKYKDTEESFVLSNFIIKGMERAYYHPDNEGHYALREIAYGHTTSPARRCVDTVLQRILNLSEDIKLYTKKIEEIEICGNVEDKAFYENLILECYEEINKINKDLYDICNKANTKERMCESAEIDGNLLATIKYLENNPDLEFEAYVVDYNSWVIKFKTTNLIEGVIPIDNINFRYIVVDSNKKKEVIVVDCNSSDTVKVGDKYTVKVSAIDKCNFNIMFDVVINRELVKDDSTKRLVRKRS